MNRIDEIRQSVEWRGYQGYEIELLDEIVRLRTLILRALPFVDESTASQDFKAELLSSCGSKKY